MIQENCIKYCILCEHQRYELNTSTAEFFQTAYTEKKSIFPWEIYHRFKFTLSVDLVHSDCNYCSNAHSVCLVSCSQLPFRYLLYERVLPAHAISVHFGY